MHIDSMIDDGLSGDIKKIFCCESSWSYMGLKNMFQVVPLYSILPKGIFPSEEQNLNFSVATSMNPASRLSLPR